MTTDFQREFGALSIGELEKGRPQAGLGLYDCTGHQNVLRYRVDHEGHVRDARNGDQVARLVRDPVTRDHLVVMPGRKPIPLPKPVPVRRPASAADRLHPAVTPAAGTTGSTFLTRHKGR